ncbi:OmpH family outer membrane protein [Desulfovibrio inopinatus]|uniref:OmpH family outer membrane protein n=1 Tax=Desulfovibrio inopinatus TaxID=102109 RepID=UPI000403FCD2|nr:OmpH family outer membrane protein [Desulfovibrio inopinatus]
MRKLTVVLLTAFFMAVSVVPSMAQSKVGVINLDDALVKTRLGKSAMSQLKRKFQSREKQLSAQESRLKTLREELSKSGILSDKAKREKATQFESQLQQFMNARNAFQQEFQAEQKRLLDPIVAKMQKAVDDYARQKGFDLILEARSVPYYKSELDITDKVIKLVDR